MTYLLFFLAALLLLHNRNAPMRHRLTETEFLQQMVALSQRKQDTARIAAASLKAEWCSGQCRKPARFDATPTGTICFPSHQQPHNN